jgi:molybdopterin-guanine dinucleotide biosynthesis protein A
MGRDKALLEVGGETLLQRAVALVRGAGGTPIVVGRLRPPEQISGARQIDEASSGGRPACGPLMALRWGLAECGTERAMALACDIPFITADLIHYLLAQSEGVDAVVPRCGDLLHVLAAVYMRDCLPAIDRRLAAGHRSVHRLIDDLNARIVEEDELARFGGARLLDNINTPEQLARAQAAVEAEER